MSVIRYERRQIHKSQQRVWSSVNRADQQGEEKHWYWPSAPPAQSTIQFNNSYLYLRGGKHPNTFPADIRPSLIGVKILPESVWYVKLKTELRLWSHFPSSPIKQQKNLLYLLPTGPNRPGSAPQSACVCSMSPAAPKDGIGWHGPKKIIWISLNLTFKELVHPNYKQTFPFLLPLGSGPADSSDLTRPGSEWSNSVVSTSPLQPRGKEFLLWSSELCEHRHVFFPLNVKTSALILIYSSML